ncbi:MAG: hypothetical protein VX528_01695, partial [Candidatus Latescibacterota bacterium]|nr:hypothetical protein [Candidatus Latescibacterota bacterium]
FHIQCRFLQPDDGEVTIHFAAAILTCRDLRGLPHREQGNRRRTRSKRGGNRLVSDGGCAAVPG